MIAAVLLGPSTVSPGERYTVVRALIISTIIDERIHCAWMRGRHLLIIQEDVFGVDQWSNWRDVEMTLRPGLSERSQNIG